MVKIAYVKSDYHPCVLIHTDRSGLMEVSNFLYGLVGSTTEVELLGEGSEGHLSLRAVLNDRCEGISISSSGILWSISNNIALHYAEEVKAIYRSGEKSGSLFMEVGYLNEIPVKLTFGEFDDDFFEK